MIKKVSVSLRLGLVVAVSMMLPGCSDKPVSAPENRTAAKVASEAATKSEPLEPKKKRYDFPDEIYGDPEIWSTPRLQFVWQHPDEKRLSIWSMRIDGTDVRRVVSPKELENKPGLDYWMNSRPVRSPNNRYLAAEITDQSKGMLQSYIIFDLKRKTKKVYLKSGGNPHYTWTRDSKFIYMYAGRYFSKYDVKKDTFTKKERVITKRLALIENDTKLLSILVDCYRLYDLDGNMIKEVLLPLKKELSDSRGHCISAEGNRLKLLGRRGFYEVILEVKPPHKKIFEYEGRDFSISSAIFMPGGNQLVGYFYDDEGHSLFDIKTKKFTRFYGAEINSYEKLTLINHPVHKDK